MRLDAKDKLNHLHRLEMDRACGVWDEDRQQKLDDLIMELCYGFKNEDLRVRGGQEESTACDGTGGEIIQLEPGGTEHAIHCRLGSIQEGEQCRSA